MIQLTKTNPQDFEIEQIMGNILHISLFDHHFKISSYEGGWAIAFSALNMYELEYTNLKKRPDLTPPKDTWYKVLLRIG